MRRSQITFLAIVAVIIAIAAVYFATRKVAVAPATTPSPSPSASAVSNSPAAASPAASASPKTSAVVLQYTGTGFSPASVTVTAGQQLTVQNTTATAIQVDSNPHPVHTDDPELNIGPIAAGASATVTLNKTGTFGIHNHLDPSVQATVTIR